MKQYLIGISIGLLLLVLTSCDQETKSKNLYGAAKILESNFSGKEKARKEVKHLANQYIETFDKGNEGFDERYNLFSKNYLQKVKKLIRLAKTANKNIIKKLALSDQVQVFNYRKGFSYEELDTMTIKEIMKKQLEENIVIGMSDSEIDRILFYTPTQACGFLKNIFSTYSILFDKENKNWKIDPTGDPLHQKMKEEKLATLQKKSMSEYKEYMYEILEIKEIDWIPLDKR